MFFVDSIDYSDSVLAVVVFLLIGRGGGDGGVRLGPMATGVAAVVAAAAFEQLAPWPFPAAGDSRECASFRRRDTD